MTNQMKHTH